MGVKSYPSPERAASHTGEWMSTSPPKTSVARRGGTVVVVEGSVLELVDDADAGVAAGALGVVAVERDRATDAGADDDRSDPERDPASSAALVPLLLVGRGA